MKAVIPALYVLALFMVPALARENAEPEINEVAASDVERLTKLAGLQTVVTGEVASAITSDKGAITFLNFSSTPQQGFVAVLFPRYRESFTHIDFSNLAGKEVEVRGIIEMFKGQPQIKLTESSQLRLAAAE